MGSCTGKSEHAIQRQNYLYNNQPSTIKFMKDQSMFKTRNDKTYQQKFLNTTLKRQLTQKQNQKGKSKSTNFTEELLSLDGQMSEQNCEYIGSNIQRLSQSDVFLETISSFMGPRSKICRQPSYLSILSTNLHNPKNIVQIISTYDEMYCQSVMMKKILTTAQFQKIVEKVQFIYSSPFAKFQFLTQLGQGGACKVYYVKSKKQNKFYAVRVINIKDQKKIKKIKNQIAVMHVCSNPFTIQYYFSYYYQQSLYMFIQYMNMSSLNHFIKKNKNIDQDIVSYILKKILQGLKVIHKKHQIHRDLKSDNILLNSNGDIKIADFGQALQLTKQKLHSKKDIVGTPAWMAPELIKQEQYNEKVDIWALGIVAIQLCVGQAPHLRMNHIRTMYNIISKPSPKIQNKSDNFVQFVDSCLKKNSSQRPNVHNLLKHPFITQHKQQFQKQKFAQLIAKSLSK